MGELIKFEIIELPPLCMIGRKLDVSMEGMKSHNPIPDFWGKCFADGTFAELEKLSDFVFDSAYVGWMSDYSDGGDVWSYVCGMLMKPGCPVPEGFICREIAPSEVAVGWIQGKDTPDVCSDAHKFTSKALNENGYTDKESVWCMELYNCPRYTVPDKNGKIILDYYIPCVKQEAI